MAALLALVLAGGAVTAWAIWSAAASSTSHGAASGATVNQGSTPTASGAPGATVTVSWAASTLSNGHAVDGYVIRRYTTAGLVLQTTLAGCAGTISATSCVESSVPDGSWRYGVTPVIATNWQGAESAKGTAILVDTTPPAASAQLDAGGERRGLEQHHAGRGDAERERRDGVGRRQDLLHDERERADDVEQRLFVAAVGQCQHDGQVLRDRHGGQRVGGADPAGQDRHCAAGQLLSLSSVSGGAVLSATTVYYRGSAAGSLA